MGSFVQTALPTQLTSPFGPNKLLVRSYRGEEAISALYRYDLELYSEDASLDFSQIVGKPVTLQIQLSSGSFSYMNGMVGRFTQGAKDDRFTTYFAEVHPWLWMLTMNSDCRIFQNKNTLEIVKQVFSDLGFSDFSDKTTGTYAAREYCVQYRETSFAFVSRLLEEEGIAYYFTHDAAKHTMVLVDDTSSWGTCPGLTAARYVGTDPKFDADDMVTDCVLEQAVTVGKFKSDDYPGLYAVQSDGEKIASRRLASLQTKAKVLRGSGFCRTFHAGAKFTLTGYYRADGNADYVLRHLAVNGTQDDYQNTFEAFPVGTAFHPPRTTPSPLIAGTQTATVVGKAGEEIWTDKYGRVVVQFHWDQLGTNDEKSSCWVRVAQGWAGNLWGSIFIPRIGQEVVVSFLEGNPDRPLITGCVYNAQQLVPYTLPDEMTRSTVKTNSSKGGSGFNEICFEDKAGSEELFIQAQKDMTVSVLNNESLTVKGTRTLAVTGDETHTNQGNHTTTISKDCKLTISGNLTIEASGSISIKSGTTFEITAGTSLTNKAGTELTNKSGTDMTNDAGTTLTNKAAASQTVDGGGMLTVKGGMVKIN